MKYIIPIILFVVALSYFVYYIILNFRYFKGDKMYGTVKDYKKYKRYRSYLLKIPEYGIIDYVSTRFYMINTRILLSRYKDKYYTKENIKDVFFKTISMLIVTLILFIYILSN